MVIPEAYRGSSALRAALADQEQAAKLRAEVVENLTSRSGGATLQIASYAKNRAWQGMNLAAVAAQRGIEVVDLVLEIEQNGGAKMVSFGMQEEEVRLIMRQAFVATASDGSAMVPGDTVPHPRSYGCFPRKVGRYVLEEQVLGLPQAIRSATSLPAEILGLSDRGLLRPGFRADIVVFDPETYRDVATFEKPHQYSTGVRYLFVNGKAAIDEGRVTGVLAGRALRHSATP